MIYTYILNIYVSYGTWMNYAHAPIYSNVYAIYGNNIILYSRVENTLKTH